jgi:hypothetical protein
VLAAGLRCFGGNSRGGDTYWLFVYMLFVAWIESTGLVGGLRRLWGWVGHFLRCCVGLGVVFMWRAFGSFNDFYVCSS